MFNKSFSEKKKKKQKKPKNSLFFPSYSCKVTANDLGVYSAFSINGTDYYLAVTHSNKKKKKEIFIIATAFSFLSSLIH